MPEQIRRNSFTSASLQKLPGIIYLQETCLSKSKTSTNLANHVPAFTILHVPSFQAVPSIDGTNSEVFVVVDYSKQMVLIGGTNYAGEIKKSVFSVLNYLLPKKHSVLSMHCSAKYRLRWGFGSIFWSFWYRKNDPFCRP